MGANNSLSFQNLSHKISYANGPDKAIKVSRSNPNQLRPQAQNLLGSNNLDKRNMERSSFFPKHALDDLCPVLALKEYEVHTKQDLTHHFSLG